MGLVGLVGLCGLCGLCVFVHVGLCVSVLGYVGLCGAVCGACRGVWDCMGLCGAVCGGYVCTYVWVGSVRLWGLWEWVKLFGPVKSCSVVCTCTYVRTYVHT